MKEPKNKVPAIPVRLYDVSAEDFMEFKIKCIKNKITITDAFKEFIKTYITEGE